MAWGDQLTSDWSWAVWRGEGDTGSHAGRGVPENKGRMVWVLLTCGTGAIESIHEQKDPLCFLYPRAAHRSGIQSLGHSNRGSELLWTFRIYFYRKRNWTTPPSWILGMDVFQERKISFYDNNDDSEAVICLWIFIIECHICIEYPVGFNNTQTEVIHYLHGPG